jgi:hypothetical protein
MRDDQIHHLIQKELTHFDGINLLRIQQIKLRMDAMTEVIANPLNLVRGSKHMFSEIDRVYKEKAQEYNKKLQEQLTKEKLKV